MFIVSVCSIVALYFLDASMNLLLCWMSLFCIFVFGFRLLWSSMQNIYLKYCLWLCLYPRCLGLHPHQPYFTTTLRLQSYSSSVFYFSFFGFVISQVDTILLGFIIFLRDDISANHVLGIAKVFNFCYFLFFGHLIIRGLFRVGILSISNVFHLNGKNEKWRGS
jgi:hypothetical protein